MGKTIFKAIIGSICAAFIIAGIILVLLFTLVFNTTATIVSQAEAETSAQFHVDHTCHYSGYSISSNFGSSSNDYFKLSSSSHNTFDIRYGPQSQSSGLDTSLIEVENGEVVGIHAGLIDMINNHPNMISPCNAQSLLQSMEQGCDEAEERNEIFTNWQCEYEHYRTPDSLHCFDNSLSQTLSNDHYSILLLKNDILPIMNIGSDSYHIYFSAPMYWSNLHGTIIEVRCGGSSSSSGSAVIPHGSSSTFMSDSIQNYLSDCEKFSCLDESECVDSKLSSGWQGDGFCDSVLNCQEYNFDDGDCFYSSSSSGTTIITDEDYLNFPLYDTDENGSLDFSEYENMFDQEKDLNHDSFISLTELSEPFFTIYYDAMDQNNDNKLSSAEMFQYYDINNDEQLTEVELYTIEDQLLASSGFDILFESSNNLLTNYSSNIGSEGDNCEHFSCHDSTKCVDHYVIFGWPGDGFCDSDLNCEEYNMDEGDCSANPSSSSSNSTFEINSDIPVYDNDQNGSLNFTEYGLFFTETMDSDKDGYITENEMPDDSFELYLNVVDNNNDQKLDAHEMFNFHDYDANGQVTEEEMFIVSLMLAFSSLGSD